MCIAFRGSNAASTVSLRYLKVLEHKKNLNDINNDRRDNFEGWKTLRKVKPMYLEVKLREDKFN